MKPSVLSLRASCMWSTSYLALFPAGKYLFTSTQEGLPAAMPALTSWGLVRPMSSRMMGSRGEAANVDRKEVKNANQAKWNARMWGRARLNILMVFALCSLRKRKGFDKSPLDWNRQADKAE
jgi:hypothetical protein